jgi:drug/metabolite transporter (DMT)-like permease
MTRLQANLLLLLAAALWGSGNVAQKTILADLGPFSAIGLRCLVAFLVVLPFAWRERRQLQLSSDAGKLLAGVAVSFAAATTLLQICYGGTSVTNAGFFVNTCSVMTPMIAWLLLRSKPSFMVFPAIALSIGGIFLMGGGVMAALSWGDGLALASAFFYALWAVLLGALLLRLPSPFFITAASFAFTALAGLTLGSLGLDGADRPISLTAFAGAAPELLYLGVLSTGVAYTLQVIAQGHTTATSAMIIVSAEAIFGAIAASVILGEMLMPMGWAGAAMVTAGILLVALPSDYPRRKRVTLEPRAPKEDDKVIEIERALANLRRPGNTFPNKTSPQLIQQAQPARRYRRG